MLEKMKERLMRMSKMEKILAIIVALLIVFIAYCAAVGDDYVDEDTSVNDEYNVDDYNNDQQEQEEQEEADVYDNALATDTFVENYLKEQLPGYDITFRRNDTLVFITITAPDVDAAGMPQSVINETVQMYGLSDSTDVLADKVEQCYKDSGKDVYCSISLYDVNGIKLYESK